MYQTPKTLKRYALSRDLESKARLLALAGDQTRIRILCVLFQNQEVCVSDIGNSLGMSVSAISHQLRLLKANNLVGTKRVGQNICYFLHKSNYTNQLKKIICG